MVNRDRHEIVIDILTKAKNGKRKTELMRDAGLSYLQTKQYLTTLIEKGLLEIDKNNNLKTTKKGQEFLQKCGECLLTNWHKQKENKTKNN
ncbi:MAG: winged helix-turn-helix domain-containing protein [Candidatus Bathyarchaeia archaeon]